MYGGKGTLMCAACTQTTDTAAFCNFPAREVASLVVNYPTQTYWQESYQVAAIHITHMLHRNMACDVTPYLVNESEVMGYKHKATLEALDGLCQRVNGFNVQMVGGLIQQQQVGVLHADHGKHKAALLAIAQLPNPGCLHLACTPTVGPVTTQAGCVCMMQHTITCSVNTKQTVVSVHPSSV